MARGFLRALPDGEAALWRTDPQVVNALLHGAVDPDMGYFPGGDRLVTDLSHYVKSADLIRQLVRLAENPVERAYAWGWVTHFVADSRLHPTINRSSGMHIHGSPDRPATWVDGPSVHFRVEQGLDAHRLTEDPGLRRIRLERLGDETVSLLASAYEQTYGVRLDGSGVAKARRSLRWTQRLVFRWGPLLRVGYSPPEWLISEMTSAEASLGPTFSRLFDTGLDELENLNLDTGEMDSEENPYPKTSKALAELEKRRSIG